MSKYSTNEMTSAEQQRVTVVGVDLGKTWIEVCGQSASGKVSPAATGLLTGFLHSQERRTRRSAGRTKEGASSYNSGRINGRGVSSYVTL